MMYQSDVLLTFTVYRSDLFQHKVYDGWFLNFDVVFYCPWGMCLDQIVHACCIISPTHCITNATRESLYNNIATIYTLHQRTLHLLCIYNNVNTNVHRYKMMQLWEFTGLLIYEVNFKFWCHMTLYKYSWQVVRHQIHTRVNCVSPILENTPVELCNTHLTFVIITTYRLPIYFSIYIFTSKLLDRDGG